ncbi:hypothetical protein GCM10010402_40190 [Actinomadura luteofluorescens]
MVAYRKQHTEENAALREDTKLHSDRFTAAVTQLGDTSPAVQLSGVHALAPGRRRPYAPGPPDLHRRAVRIPAPALRSRPR